MERGIYFVGSSLCPWDGNHARGRDFSRECNEVGGRRREGGSGDASRVCESQRKISFKDGVISGLSFIKKNRKK